MMLGLMRWSSIHWELARAWRTAGEGERVVLAAIFDGLEPLSRQLRGRVPRRVLPELLVRPLRGRDPAPAAGPARLGGGASDRSARASSARSATSCRWSAAVAVVNNILLPAWMIGFGVWLILDAKRTGQAVDGPPRA
jgi:hypothetical protein